jgi:hypothetical protein
VGGGSKTGRRSAPLVTNGGAKPTGVDRSNDDNDLFKRFIFVAHEGLSEFCALGCP